MKTKLLFQVMLSALLLGGCATGHDRAPRRNTEIIQRYFEGWANHGDTAVADELIATNVVLHNPPAVLHSLAEYKQGMAIFHTAFPDLHFTVDDLVAAGDKIVVRWTLHGTHRGDYQGRPATGKTMTITGVSMFCIAGGKIQEIHVNVDRLGMQQQLGWLPALPQPAK
jgi:steroid delta-isomerase-like uncharacterized protein